VQHVHGIEFDVHLNCYVQEQAPPRPDDPSAQTIVLEFGEVLLRLIQVDITNAGRELLEYSCPSHFFRHVTTELSTFDGGNGAMLQCLSIKLFLFVQLQILASDISASILIHQK
jgi:hypothetical protein